MQAHEHYLQLIVALPEAVRLRVQTPLTQQVNQAAMQDTIAWGLGRRCFITSAFPACCQQYVQRIHPCGVSPKYMSTQGNKCIMHNSLFLTMLQVIKIMTAQNNHHQRQLLLLPAVVFTTFLQMGLTNVRGKHPCSFALDCRACMICWACVQASRMYQPVVSADSCQ